MDRGREAGAGFESHGHCYWVGDHRQKQGSARDERPYGSEDDTGHLDHQGVPHCRPVRQERNPQQEGDAGRVSQHALRWNDPTRFHTTITPHYDANPTNKPLCSVCAMRSRIWNTKTEPMLYGVLHHFVMSGHPLCRTESTRSGGAS